MKKLEVVYEDDLCLVMNKPAGLAVQGGKDIKISLDKILVQTWPNALLVHRLDRDTSGLILVAKSREAAAKFSAMFAGGKITRRYTAVCFGSPMKVEGIINLEIDVRGRQKSSETRYRVIKTLDCVEAGISFSVLELSLETGRMHQIRRHLSITGNPILGDDKYGDFSINKKLKKIMGLKNQLLHASYLAFEAAKGYTALCSPPPEYFSRFLVTG